MKKTITATTSIICLWLSFSLRLVNAAELKVDFDGKAIGSVNFSDLLNNESEYPNPNNTFPQQIGPPPLSFKDPGRIDAKEAIIIKVLIETREKKTHRDLACGCDSKTKTPIDCYKKSDGKKITREDIDSLVLERFLPETGIAFSFFDLPKHSYTNCSGPELFHCDDHSYMEEICRNEYVCWPGGLIPDNCNYVKYCYTREVYTHTCSVVGSCVKKYSPSGIPAYSPFDITLYEAVE